MKPYRIPEGYNFFQSISRTIKQVRDPIGSMEESMRKYDGTYSVMLGSSKFIVTQDPAFIDYVLRGNHRNYHKSPIQTKQLGRFLGNGLLTSNGEYWLRQRRLIQPGFHTEKIQALYEIIQRTIDNFLDKFPCGKSIDVYPLTNRLAFEIVINTLFNIDVPDSVQNELSRLIYELQDYVIRDLRQVYKRWWFRLSGENELHLKKSRRVREIIRQMIRDRKASSQKFNDLLDMLLEAKYEDNGEHMNEDQLIDEITILIIAGHETTANALAWTLYLAANHPQEQVRLRESALSLSVTDSVMSEYFNSVIKESMRLYPPAWISDRLSINDDSYNSFDIPAGTILVLFYYGLHRDPKHWSQPEDFNPERFSKKNFDKEKSKAYYPFGAGPRLCIGNSFAMAEMTIFLQRFFSRFSVSPTDQRPKLVPLVTLKPDNVVLEITKLPVSSATRSIPV
jgi:cytochrome P450